MTPHQRRLYAMAGLSALSFTAATAALAAPEASAGAPGFTWAVAVGVAAQVWFIVASVRRLTPKVEG